MNDPYKVLGVSPNATDDEIKTAYRNLAKKYHPDHYADSPLSDLASEKMKEINEAYDAVIKMRKNGSSYSSAGSYSSNAYNNAQSYGNAQSYNASYSQATSYPDVRNMMQNGRFADAEQILNGVPTSSRNSEWYYLKGMVLYRRGWLDEAFRNLQTACSQEPNNLEYRMALNRLQTQRGGFGGYNTAPGSSLSGYDICGGLLAADCCCECLGGDLIPCC